MSLTSIDIEKKNTGLITFVSEKFIDISISLLSVQKPFTTDP